MRSESTRAVKESKKMIGLPYISTTHHIYYIRFEFEHHAHTIFSRLPVGQIIHGSPSGSVVSVAPTRGHKLHRGGRQGQDWGHRPPWSPSDTHSASACLRSVVMCATPIHLLPPPRRNPCRRVRVTSATSPGDDPCTPCPSTSLGKGRAGCLNSN